MDVDHLEDGPERVRLRGGLGSALPDVGAVLAVLAHPDDESFGLGAALAALAGSGARVGVLCFTQGGASTLGDGGDDLASVRAAELAAAAGVLGVDRVTLLDHPDGGLQGVPLAELAAAVDRFATELAAELLVVFDEGGVTGHPDHERASEAALAAGGDLPVLAWALPEATAHQLNAELSTSFVGRRFDELDLAVQVDRTCQVEAIACHESQVGDNPVLWRRLALLGGEEVFRWLRPPRTPPSPAAASPASAQDPAR